MGKKGEFPVFGRRPSMTVFLVLGIILLIFAIVGVVFGLIVVLNQSSSPKTSSSTMTSTTTTTPTPYTIGALVVDPIGKTITISGGKNGSSLVINMGLGVTSSNLLVTASTSNSIAYSWPDQQIQLEVSLAQASSSAPNFDMNEYVVSWTTSNPMRDYLEDHVQFGTSHWYGGAEMFVQKWPVETIQHSMAPYTTNDIFRHSFGNLQERYWLSSNYHAITVDDTAPLWLAYNNPNGTLALHAQYTDSQYINFVKRPTMAFPFLKYSVWTPSSNAASTTLTNFHLTLLNHLFDLPSGTPDLRMISDPIWSTWARYKKPINQTTVLAYANEIVQNGFTNSQLEIDDAWATHYGDMVMDPNKFPEPKAMTKQLKDMGFRSTIWVHPFANVDSVTANTPANVQYWVQQKDTNLASPDPNDPPVPALVAWWDGVGVILDATNPAAQSWFVNRMETFKNDTGIDSYKFDAGETNWLPDSYRLFAGTVPNDYSKSYAEMCSKLGNLIEVRVGSRTQKLANFVRILDRDSRWTEDNGLASVIPATLLFGLLGNIRLKNS